VKTMVAERMPEGIGEAVSGWCSVLGLGLGLGLGWGLGIGGRMPEGIGEAVS